MPDVYDVLVIGGGVVGCAIARELTRYKLRIGLVEKESDVARGTSGRNSGVVHAGFYVKPGTLKAKLNVEGHRMFRDFCRELDVPYDEVGKVVVAKTEEEMPYIEKLKKQGEENKTAELRMIGREELSKIEPNIKGVAALYSPKSAIMCPFTLTIALAENSLKNGASIFLNTEVMGISRDKGVFIVKTNRGNLKSRIVVNSAGTLSAKVAEMAGINDYRIYPCRGEYYVLDKRIRSLVNGLVYPVPPHQSGGLGVHITPTIHGNVMLGPSAEYINDCEDTSNTSEVMEKLYREASELLPQITRRDFIRSFAGIRAKIIGPGDTTYPDFVIGESQVKGFINLIGIESPGLTAAPAIAKMVAGIIGNSVKLEPNPNFDPVRKGSIRFSHLSDDEKARMIEQNNDYGIVVCRCETVTKQEVKDAINNPLGVRTINAIKNRCRAGMGRCQAGFCTPKIVEILEKEFGMNVDEFTLMGPDSEMFVGRTKDMRRKK